MYSILNTGYEQIILLQNSLNLAFSETLDTYVYKIGIAQSRYSYAAAVGLLKSILSGGHHGGAEDAGDRSHQTLPDGHPEGVQDGAVQKYRLVIGEGPLPWPQEYAAPEIVHALVETACHAVPEGAAAVGLLKSILSVTLMLLANHTSKKALGRGLF